MVTQILNQKAFTKPRWKKYTENRKITQYAEKTEENIKECRNFFFLTKILSWGGRVKPLWISGVLNEAFCFSKATHSSSPTTVFIEV